MSVIEAALNPLPWTLFLMHVGACADRSSPRSGNVEQGVDQTFLPAVAIPTAPPGCALELLVNDERLKCNSTTVGVLVVEPYVYNPGSCAVVQDGQGVAWVFALSPTAQRTGSQVFCTAEGCGRLDLVFGSVDRGRDDVRVRGRYGIQDGDRQTPCPEFAAPKG